MIVLVDGTYPTLRPRDLVDWVRVLGCHSIKIDGTLASDLSAEYEDTRPEEPQTSLRNPREIIAAIDFFAVQTCP